MRRRNLDQKRKTKRRQNSPPKSSNGTSSRDKTPRRRRITAHPPSAIERSNYDKLNIDGNEKPRDYEIQNKTPDWLRPHGAPQKYNPDYHPSRAVHLLAEGCSVVELTIEFGIYPSTLYRWLDKYDTFRDAVMHGLPLAEAWWRRMGRINLNERSFNHNLWNLNMANRYGWSKKYEVQAKDSEPVAKEFGNCTPKELLPHNDDDDMIDVVNVADEVDPAERTASILEILVEAGAFEDDDEDEKPGDEG